jgi:hypothetical protein
MQETIRYDLDNSRFEHTVKLETWPDGTVIVPAEEINRVTAATAAALASQQGSFGGKDVDWICGYLGWDYHRLAKEVGVSRATLLAYARRGRFSLSVTKAIQSFLKP